MNELLFIIEIVMCFLALSFSYKNSKKSGLLAFMIFAIVLGNVVSIKTITVFNLDVSLGIPLYTSLFLAFNMYVQKYGKEDILKIISMVVISSIISSVFLIVGTTYENSEMITNSNSFFNRVFFPNMRLVFSSIISTSIAMFVAANIYFSIKKEQNTIWVSNVFSIIVSQFIDTIIFIGLSSVLDFDPKTLLSICMSRYFLRMIIGILGTVVVYRTSSID